MDRPSSRAVRGTSAGFARRVPTTTSDEQPTPRRYGIVLLFVVPVVLLSIAGGWYLVTTKEEQERLPAWQACLLEEKNSFASPDEQMQPSLMVIPAGTYVLPSRSSGLYAFLEPYGMEIITIEEPFLMQDQKMNRRFFEQYADFVESIPSEEEKEQHQSHLGLLWNREGENSTTVHGLSWEAATDFSRWLSQKTGCEYNIPSREQWAAAIIHLYGTGEQVPKPGDDFSSTPLTDLLRGGREWTRSPCDMGYYLVGEEKWVSGAEKNQAICMPALFSIAGFRVVLSSTQPQEDVLIPFSSDEHMDDTM